MARARSAAATLGTGGVRAGRAGGRFLSATPSSLAAAEAVTTGSLVAFDLLGKSDSKLPRPGPIVAAMGFYSMLAFAAEVSETFRPAVVASGWVLALAVLVTGKRGTGLVRLLGDLAKLAAKTGQA